MANIFYNILKEYACGEFPEDAAINNYNHCIGYDGDHSACGLAIGGSCEIGKGKITCPKCINYILFYKRLKKNIDY